MGYGILRGQKVHTSGLKGIEIHNNRERPSRSNPDIDRKKTVENYSLLEEGQKSLNKRVNARCQELSGGKKIRSDAVKMYDFIATASPEDMAKMSPAQQRRFFEDTRDFLIKKFGKENLMYAKVHMDETTPHMHVGIVPEYQGRLCAKKLFTPSSMRKLQDEYFREVSSKYGLDRGEVGSSKRHQKTRDFKRQTDYNGKEQENLKSLEAAAKERPVTEGFLNKKIIGYQVSPEWLDESLRLARVGGQAAIEKEAREKAELDLKKSLEREREANQEAARLRVDNDMLREEIRTKEKDLSEHKKSTAVFTEAPEVYKQRIIKAAHNNALERDAKFAFIGKMDRALGTKKALENPLVKGLFASMGVDKPEDRETLLRHCNKLMNGKEKGKDNGDWSPLPAPVKMLEMPLKVMKQVVEKCMDQAKSAIQSAANMGAKEQEITAGFRYLQEHDNINASPWENLTEQRKEEILAKTRYRDEY